MKTAKEWASDMGVFQGKDCENVSMKDRVQQIQLDAWNDAINYAADISEQHGQRMVAVTIRYRGTRSKIP